MCWDATGLLESTVVDSRYWYQDCPEEAARSSSAGWAWWVPRYMDLECSLNSLHRRFGKDTSPVTLFSDTAYITFGGVGIPLSWQPKWLVSAFKTLTLNVSIEQPCRHLCGAEFNRIQRWRHCSRLSHICCSKKWHQLYFQRRCFCTSAILCLPSTAPLSMLGTCFWCSICKSSLQGKEAFANDSNTGHREVDVPGTGWISQFQDFFLKLEATRLHEDQMIRSSNLSLSRH